MTKNNNFLSSEQEIYNILLSFSLIISFNVAFVLKDILLTFISPKFL